MDHSLRFPLGRPLMLPVVASDKPPVQPCRTCRHFEVHLSRPRPWICLLNSKLLEVPMVYDCRTYEREPGSDDE